ncbi:MAG: hypothetical protein LBQ79_01625 [Deltaproteobacteria bacterium]|nr:hypothetical protein [Deltaproteobacteria bacterium]
METTTFEHWGMKLVVPTEAELIKIKSVAILARNATRDFIDLAALAEHSGPEKTIAALKDLDRVCHLDNSQSALQLLQIMLLNPVPKELNEINFKNYKEILPKWQNWDFVAGVLKRLAMDISDCLHPESDPRPSGPRP